MWGKVGGAVVALIIVGGMIVSISTPTASSIIEIKTTDECKKFIDPYLQYRNCYWDKK